MAHSPCSSSIHSCWSYHSSKISIWQPKPSHHLITYPWTRQDSTRFLRCHWPRSCLIVSCYRPCKAFLHLCLACWPCLLRFLRRLCFLSFFFCARLWRWWGNSSKELEARVWEWWEEVWSGRQAMMVDLLFESCKFHWRGDQCMKDILLWSWRSWICCSYCSPIPPLQNRVSKSHWPESCRKHSLYRCCCQLQCKPHKVWNREEPTNESYCHKIHP